MLYWVDLVNSRIYGPSPHDRIASCVEQESHTPLSKCRQGAKDRIHVGKFCRVKGRDLLLPTEGYDGTNQPGH